MEEKPTDSSNEAGLHEYVDAEFIVAGLESPSREKTLRDTLQKLQGLEKLNISHGKVTAHYEPVLLVPSRFPQLCRCPKSMSVALRRFSWPSKPCFQSRERFTMHEQMDLKEKGGRGT